MEFMKKIFSIKNDKRNYKIINLLGIKIKFKTKYNILKSKYASLDAKYNILNNNINTIKAQCFISLSKNLTCKKALEDGYIKSEDEHLKNIKELKKNLDENALKNFNTIYEKILLAEQNNSLPIWDFFSMKELDEIRKAKNIKFQIQNKGDYFQYKNYKLPINRFDYAIFEKKQCLSHIKTLNNINNKTIIDAGGFLCDSTLIIREFTQAPIITFEPVKKHYEYCTKTKELNNIKNLTIENLALGDKEEESEILANIDIPGASNLLGITYNCKCETQTCKITTIDNYVQKNNLEIGMIKTDVEGFEMQLLKGAINTIKEQRPILLISIYHNYNDFYKIKPFIENLNLNYKFNIVKDMDEYYYTDIYLIAEPN